MTDGGLQKRRLAQASSVSLPTIRRLESSPGTLAAHGSTISALMKSLEVAGIEFIHENGGGPGVRLRKRHQTTRYPTDSAANPMAF